MALAPTSASLSAPAPPPKLSADLEELLARAGEEAMTVREMEAALRGRGFAVVVLVLCMPFLFPASIPGVSTVFGWAVALIGMRLAVGKHPWLPAFLLDRSIPSAPLRKVLKAGIRLARFVERFIRPRMRFLERHPWLLQLNGALVTLNGLLLAVPIPGVIPLTNTIPALAIILLMLGRMEKDGLVTLFGYFVTAVAVAYFTLLAIYGTALVGWITDRFGW